MILWDEITEPDVDLASRMYCHECGRHTLFNFYDGERVCREHTQEIEEIES